MEITSCAARVTIGSIMTERDNAAAKPVCPASSAGRPQEVDEEAGDDGRGPRHGVNDVAHHRGEHIAVVDQVRRRQYAQGTVKSVASPHLFDRAHDRRPAPTR